MQRLSRIKETQDIHSSARNPTKSHQMQTHHCPFLLPVLWVSLLRVMTNLLHKDPVADGWPSETINQVTPASGHPPPYLYQVLELGCEAMTARLLQHSQKEGRVTSTFLSVLADMGSRNIVCSRILVAAEEKMDKHPAQPRKISVWQEAEVQNYF